MKITLAEAGALAAILSAAQRKATVAQNDGTSVLHGTAQYVGGSLGAPRDFAAEAAADVRDLFLVVQLPGIQEARPWPVAWRVSWLIKQYQAGTFVVDFDLAAFEAAKPGEPSAALIREGRAWIADSFSDVDVARLTDDEVREGVARHYEGGWAQFRLDEGLDPGQAGNLPPWLQDPAPGGPVAFPVTAYLYDKNGDEWELADTFLIWSQAQWAGLAARPGQRISLTELDKP